MRSANPGDRNSPHPLMLTLLCLAQFMVILDMTVVNVALPDIGGSLELGRETLTWVVTGYTLTLGSLLILGGRLADSAGARLTFVAGLLLFTAASLTSGLATNGTTLVSSRLAQGVGAALLSPSALSMLTKAFTGPARQRALGVWAAIGGVGAAVGVLVGGALTSGPGWEWVFFVNVPIGLLLAAAAPVVLPVQPRRARSGLDLAGAITGTATLAFLIFAITKAGESGWGSGAVASTGAAAVVSGALFVGVERHVDRPLVPAGVLVRTSLPGGLAVMVTASAAMVSAFFLGSLYLQRTRGFSAIETGLAFLPAAAAVAVGAHSAGRVIGRFGPRRAAALGLSVAAAGLGAMGWCTGRPGLGTAGLVVAMVLASAGIGTAFVTATTSAMARIEPDHAGVASGVLTTGHEIGGSLGVAVASAVAAGSLATTAGGVGGYQQAFAVAALASVAVALLAALFLLPRRLPADQHQVFVH